MGQTLGSEDSKAVPEPTGHAPARGGRGRSRPAERCATLSFPHQSFLDTPLVYDAMFLSLHAVHELTRVLRDGYPSGLMFWFMRKKFVGS